MSSLMYGAISRQRDKVGKQDNGLALGALTQANAFASEEDKKKPVSAWLDAALALFPAEVLALHTLAITLGTRSAKDASGTEKLVINNAGEMQFAFVVLVCLALVVPLFTAGWPGKAWRKWVRLLIPPIAFVCWCLLQPLTVVDGWSLSWFHEFHRYFLGAVVITLLGLVAKKLADPPS